MFPLFKYFLHDPPILTFLALIRAPSQMILCDPFYSVDNFLQPPCSPGKFVAPSFKTF